VAQSALSHHIADLEASLGLKLFERRPKGVEMTLAGRRLFEHAKAIMSALDKAEADVRTFTDEPTGPVSLGLCHTAVECVSLGVMRKVVEQLPKVHLSLTESMSSNLINQVLSGDVDMAVVYNPPPDGRLKSLALLKEDLYLIGHPDVIGASHDPIAFANIPQKTVINLLPTETSRALIASHFLRKQIAANDILEIYSLSALKQALVAMLGCSILAKATVGSELSTGQLHARLIVEPKLTRELRLVWLSEFPVMRAFLEVQAIIASEIADVVRSGSWPGEDLQRNVAAKAPGN